MRVEKRLSENYIPPPKPPVQPFGGSGNRLGSPLPANAVSISSAPDASQTSSSVTPQSPSTIVFEVDNTLPVTSVQIRLADGTRMVTRLNHGHTVGDLRRQIAASVALPSLPVPAQNYASNS